MDFVYIIHLFLIFSSEVVQLFLILYLQLSVGSWLLEVFVEVSLVDEQGSDCKFKYFSYAFHVCVFLFEKSIGILKDILDLLFGEEDIVLLEVFTKLTSKIS